MQSMSDTKKSRKQSIDNRTAKTKASATKPELFGISLTRNKNNHNPALFNSVKKKKSFTLEQVPQNHQYQSEKKQKNRTKQHPSLFEDLNTKVSINYINSLNSDLLVQFGYQLQSQLQNKQNHIGVRNLSINLPSKQERQCFNQVKDLIQLKDKVNKSYKCMQNTQNLFDYLANHSNQLNFEINIRKTDKIDEIHKEISNFLTHFKIQCTFPFKLEKQLELLQQKYKDFIENNTQQQEQKSQQELDQEHLDSIIQCLKQEIANEKRHCIRYEKEEKFLMNKLYFTQKKNNDLKASSTNLQIKNTNLRDTIKLKPLNSAQKGISSPKLHRSFSVKLQRIKKYNLEDEGGLIKETQEKMNKMTRSKSASSLESFSKGSYQPAVKKETFLDRIQ